jgi:hypothetical protein
MTDTPRTDTEAFPVEYALLKNGTELVLASYARTLERELAATKRLLVEASKDAERYRWLRDTADRDNDGHCYIASDEWIGEGDGDDKFDEGVSTNWLQQDEADAAIDAAIKEQK